MLNRAALIVRPKQPYLDWAAGVDEEGQVPDSEGDQTVYLIPEFENDEEARSVLTRVCEEVFERELEAWHADESAWPHQRDLATFLAWFSVEMHSVVEDVVEDVLIEDDL